MKKLVLLLVLVLTLTLSGCDTDNIQDNVINREHLEKTYYTQDEVDTLLKEILKDNYGNYTFDYNNDYWLIRIVSRTRDEENNIYIYELEEVGDEDYIVELESKELFSINELVIGVETNNDIFIIDFNNGNVIMPIENE